MRADRLISIILLLQTRGNFSARELAEKLEVSERTIYRDIEALSQSGIPVYTNRGPGGGIFLVENYRTSLTGMTDEQIQALFMLNTPRPLIQLGAGEALKTALLKLTAALPAQRNKEDELTRQRFYLDWESGHPQDTPVPYLEILKQGVWQDRRVRLKYKPHFWATVEQVVEPLGLIAKGNAWHLVCMHDDHYRALSVEAVFEAQLLEEHFIRPPDFDLAEFWHNWLTGVENHRPRYPVKVRVSPILVNAHPAFMGALKSYVHRQSDTPDEHGWFHFELNFESLEAARDRLIAFGSAVEVLEPQALRFSIADFARQALSVYDRQDKE